MPAALLTTDKRSMELWLISQGGKPSSLGLIAAGQPVRINVPAELLTHVGSGATLAVSLEPPGGSPTGQPTGPVYRGGGIGPALDRKRRLDRLRRRFQNLPVK